MLQKQYVAKNIFCNISTTIKIYLVNDKLTINVQISIKQALKNESHSHLMWDAEVVLTPLVARVLIATIINCLIYS